MLEVQKSESDFEHTPVKPFKKMSSNADKEGIFVVSESPEMEHKAETRYFDHLTSSPKSQGKSGNKQVHNWDLNCQENSIKSFSQTNPKPTNFQKFPAVLKSQQRGTLFKKKLSVIEDHLHNQSHPLTMLIRQFEVELRKLKGDHYM